MSDRRPKAATGLAAVRLAWAVVLLWRPGPVLTRLGGTDTPARRGVARVLGARQAAQATVEIAAGASGHRLGATVDGLHCLTDIAAAVADPSWRGPAAADAVVAGAFAVAGALT